MTIKKKISLGLMAALVVIAAAGLYFYENMERYLGPSRTPTEMRKVDMDRPLEEQTRIVEIGGRTFEFPIAYIDSHLGLGRKQDGVVFEYVLPDFKSKYDMRTKQAYKRAFEARRFAGMLIQPEDAKPPLQQMIDNSRANEEMTKYEGVVYGLKKYIDYDSKLHANLRWDDTYLEEDQDGKLISFIRCTPDGEAPFPGCSHKFYNKGFLYNIHYNKNNYFSSWREQREKAIEFIDRYEIHPNQNSSGE